MADIINICPIEIQNTKLSERIPKALASCYAPRDGWQNYTLNVRGSVLSPAQTRKISELCWIQCGITRLRIVVALTKPASSKHSFTKSAIYSFKPKT